MHISLPHWSRNFMSIYYSCLEPFKLLSLDFINEVQKVRQE